jgi:PAS domain S-box-containing protein
MSGLSFDQLQRENERLRWRLEETEDTIRALREGEVDAVLVSGEREQVLTLETTDKPYRLLVDEMPVSAATLTQAGEIIHCNARFAALLKLPCEEIAGRHLGGFVAPEHRPQLQAMLHAGRTAPAECELSFCCADGTLFAACLAVTPRQGGALGECLVVTDLTEHRRYEELRRTQEALTVAQARLELAQDAGKIGIFEWHVRTGEMTWSRTADRLYGFAAGALQGAFDAWRRALHPDDRERAEAEYTSAVENRTELDTEFRIVRPDGQTRWISARGTLVCDSAGQPLRLLGVNTDITDQKTAHAERERLLGLERAARAQAERAVQARDQVLAFVAHDLRNPLIAIEMSASTITAAADETVRARCIDVIQRATGDMRRLIGDLLDAARIESGAFAVTPARIDTPAALLAIAEPFRLRMQSRDITFVREIPADLPPVHADRDRLNQLLSNLLDNALKFTPAGGRVRLSASATGTGIEIAVADSGPGIPADDLPHLFDRFWQADPTSRAGAGLGLAICKGIVEAHGGKITAESTPGVGATFRLTLPRAPA